jgi:hypothetical protein
MEWFAGVSWLALGLDGQHHFLTFLGVEKLFRLLGRHLTGGVGLLSFLFIFVIGFAGILLSLLLLLFLFLFGGLLLLFLFVLLRLLLLLLVFLLL